MHRQLQRSAWEHIERGKLLLRCRLQEWQSARRRKALRRPHWEERGGGIGCCHMHSLSLLVFNIMKIVQWESGWWATRVLSCRCLYCTEKRLIRWSRVPRCVFCICCARRLMPFRCRSGQRVSSTCSMTSTWSALCLPEYRLVIYSLWHHRSVAEWLGCWTCFQQVASYNPGLPAVKCG